MLTLVTPSRLTPATRDSLRFPLRNDNLTLLQLGEEQAGSDPVRLAVGRLNSSSSVISSLQKFKRAGPVDRARRSGHRFFDQ